jgi:hypothetical protein
MRAPISLPESVVGQPLLAKLMKVFGEFSLAPFEAQRSRELRLDDVKLAVAYRDATGQAPGSHWVTVLVDQRSEDVTAERFREALAEKFPERVPKPKPAEAPRVTPAEIEAEIASEHYFTAADGAYQAGRGSDYTEIEWAAIKGPLGLLTFCVLLLRNGCKVVGINHGPVDPANFDAEHGRRDAREDAIRQVWPLLGFRLRDRLSAAPQP